MAPRKSFLLRMDPKLWDELERWAAQEIRSVNGQIEHILSDAVRQRRKKKKEESEPEQN
ncbi:MAG: Arc family DNA binding domain-containing protein [Verrucomicrobia bacterium]|nr:Arc family DNA binding domain-containing protein [Verrucomicrobiota bacterium]